MNNCRFLVSLLFLILLLKAFFFLWVISSGFLSLSPDEAQYWSWSRHLDWGYYSKPPGIAWQIRLTSSLLGDTELGVRFGSVVLSSLLSIAVFSLAKESGLCPLACFWCAISLTFIPLGLLASLLAITDGALVLFWTMGATVIARGLRLEKPPNFYLLGVYIALGSLFKWPIFLLWVAMAITLYLSPRLRSPHFYGGVALSSLGLLPSLIWNREHGWVTFKHTAGNILGSAEVVGWQGNPLSFLGEQIFLLSPLLFFLLLKGWHSLWRDTKSFSLPLAFCGFSSLCGISGYTLLACFKKMQGNWCDFLIPQALLFVHGYAWQQRKGHYWIPIALLVSLCLTTLVTLLPFLPHELGGKWKSLQYKINPFRHMLGGRNLEEALKKSHYDLDKEFLFADTYQTCSLLSFYNPSQKQAYFFNLRGIRNNQFCYWPGMEEREISHSGIFAVIENHPALEKKFPNYPSFYLKELKNYFEEVFFLGEFPLFLQGEIPMRGVQLYRCQHYNGQELPSSHSY